MVRPAPLLLLLPLLPRTRMLTRFALTAVLVVASAAAATADVVHLRGGKTIEGEVTEEGRTVVVVMPVGTVSFPRSRVERIEYTESAQDELARLFGELVEGDAGAAFDLADRAGKLGQAAEQLKFTQLAVRWASADPEQSGRLLHWLRYEREPAEDADAAARLALGVGSRPRIHRSHHWRIAHDTPAVDARHRAELLETTWRKFHELADHLGLEPQPITHRLEVQLYSRYEDWAREVRKVAPRMIRMNGVYAMSTRRVLLYDLDTSPTSQSNGRRAREILTQFEERTRGLETERASIVAMEERLADGESPAADDPALRKQMEQWIADARKQADETEDLLTKARAELDSEMKSVQADVVEQELAATTHEACHQLGFASGICRPYHPVWLLEGLATLFEITSRRTFVLGTPNRRRLTDVRAAWDEKRGGDLLAVVSDDVFNQGQPDLQLAYAEAWSLAHFLSRKHPEEFAHFVAKAGPVPAGAAGREGRIAQFRSFFDQDLDALATDWRRYVERL